MDKNKINIDFNKSIKSGYKTPDNYFNDFDDKLMSSLFLDDLDNEQPYTTPKNYFESIENNIFSKLDIKTEKTKVIPLYKKVIKLIPLSAAAIVILFLSLNHFLNTPDNNFEDITIADIESWYNEGYEITYNDELALALNTTDINDNLLDQIDETNIEDYLNNINDPLLINDETE